MNNHELIVKTLGIQDMSEAEQKDIIARTEQLIVRRIENRLLSMLKPEEIQSLFENNDLTNAEMLKKIKDIIPDYDEIVKECATETVKVVSR